MSTVIDSDLEVAADNVTEVDPAHDESRVDQAAEKVRISYKCVEVSINSIPRRRSVDTKQRAEAAELFKADDDALTLMSRIWNKDEPAIQRFNRAHADVRAVFYDRRYTMPTARAGRRLLKAGKLAEFDAAIREAIAAYRQAAVELYLAMPQLAENARSTRGDTFSENDYLFDPRETCSVTVGYPVIEEDQDLAQMAPEVYQAEVHRVREEFRAAVRSCEQDMAQSLCEAVTTMAGGLAVGADGKKKVFRNATAIRVLEELDYISLQLRENSIGGDEIQHAAEELRRLFAGQDDDTLPDTLRQSDAYRQQVKEVCEQVASQLEKSAISRPRRAILRGIDSAKANDDA